MAIDALHRSHIDHGGGDGLNMSGHSIDADYAIITIKHIKCIVNGALSYATAWLLWLSILTHGKDWRINDTIHICMAIPIHTVWGQLPRTVGDHWSVCVIIIITTRSSSSLLSISTSAGIIYGITCWGSGPIDYDENCTHSTDFSTRPEKWARHNSIYNVPNSDHRHAIPGHYDWQVDEET